MLQLVAILMALLAVPLALADDGSIPDEFSLPHFKLTQSATTCGEYRFFRYADNGGWESLRTGCERNTYFLDEFDFPVVKCCYSVNAKITDKHEIREGYLSVRITRYFDNAGHRKNEVFIWRNDNFKKRSFFRFKEAEKDSTVTSVDHHEMYMQRPGDGDIARVMTVYWDEDFDCLVDKDEYLSRHKFSDKPSNRFDEVRTHLLIHFNTAKPGSWIDFDILCPSDCPDNLKQVLLEVDCFVGDRPIAQSTAYLVLSGQRWE